MGQGREQKSMVLSSLYVVSFCGTTTNKIIDEYLDTELGIDSIGMGGLELWSQRFLCGLERRKKM